MHQRILILDYGSQVTQLIARRVREAGVYCELHPGDVSGDFLKNQLILYYLQTFLAIRLYPNYKTKDVL